MTGVRPLLVSLVALLLTACAGRRSSFAVREEPFAFSNAGITLSGTLFVPDSAGRHPAVVLFHGSGPQHGDAATGFWFASHGVEALAYDKRGVGESTGDFRTVPFMDLCSDGLAAIEILKQRPDVDADKIGVWGLSQGGWLGPLAASRSTNVKFVIAVSGPAVSPGEQMIFYYANELRHAGLSEAEIGEASTLRRGVWRYLSTREGHDATSAALVQSSSRWWFPRLQQQADGLFARPAAEILDDPGLRQSRWVKSEMNYDPTVALRKLTVPSLFLFGDQDEITPVTSSVGIIRAIAAERHSGNMLIEVFPGADHTMHVEQPDGSHALASAYLDAMSRWLRRTLM